MSLLALEHVEKAYGSGSGRHVVLRDVSLEIEAGEMVAVWGLRRSGRSTLLRVAAGIEALPGCRARRQRPIRRTPGHCHPCHPNPPRSTQRRGRAAAHHHRPAEHHLLPTRTPQDNPLQPRRHPATPHLPTPRIPLRRRLHLPRRHPHHGTRLRFVPDAYTQTPLASANGQGRAAGLAAGQEGGSCAWARSCRSMNRLASSGPRNGASEMKAICGTRRDSSQTRASRTWL
jgi:hypothetical protein